MTRSFDAGCRHGTAGECVFCRYGLEPTPERRFGDTIGVFVVDPSADDDRIAYAAHEVDAACKALEDFIDARRPLPHEAGHLLIDAVVYLRRWNNARKR